jgi:hypothetical protein
MIKALSGSLALVLVSLVACSSTSSDGAPGPDCAATPDACMSRPPSCDDGKRNGDETGTDCGGSCPKACDGAKCTGAAECASGVCEPNGTCGPSAGKTCGVGLPNPCNDGETCGQDLDCSSDYCGDDQKCAAPPAGVHADGRRDGGETGVDCGGAAAPALLCPAGQPCKTSDDCLSTCNAGGTCDAPGPTDGKKNGDETDVDCGGTAAPKCIVGKACLVNGDCELLACTAGACVVPTSTDGQQNGSETDVDCGGPGVSAGGVDYKAPRCNVDKGCAAGTDCLTGACAPSGKCAVASCATAETAGITSCGAKETGDAAAAHESCCKSLVLPTRTNRRMDKYEITAGRFRTFLASAGPNVRAWVAAYIAANPTSQLAQLLAAFPVLKQLYPAADKLDALSVTAHMEIDIDNYNGIRGCYNGDGDYAANTYWMDAAHEAEFGLPARSLPRSVSDEKPLNCAMPIMFAAFCAWDGGEMAKGADYLDVWPSTYPWAASNLCPGTGGAGPGGSLPCANYNWCNGTYQNGGFTCQNLSLSTNGEVGVFYEFPIATDRSKDNEPLIAAPGRFTADATLLKAGADSWMDVFANLAEYSAEWSAGTDPTLSTFCDTSASTAPGGTACTRNYKPGVVGTLYTGIPQIGIVGDTWEGHRYDNKTYMSGGSKLPWTFQYGKFGARCVRPAAAY